jgi:hypothetical protein
MPVTVASEETLRSFAKTVAANPEVKPETAVQIVKLMLQAAAASPDAEAEVSVKITTSKPDLKRMGGCVVTGQVCTPFGCVCVCLVPPGASC